MNVHGLRILDFKTSHSKTGGGGSSKGQPDVTVCEKENIQRIGSKKPSECRVADVSDKVCKTPSKKYSFLHRRTSSETFRTPSPIKVKEQTPKNISLEDLANLKINKANQKSRFSFFNRDSILNLHLKGGDSKRNKKRNKNEYDTAILLDKAAPNKTSAKKPVKNEETKTIKNNILPDDTFGFLKNNRSIRSCYRLNYNFINLDPYLDGLRKFKKVTVANICKSNEKKINKRCTCVHFPLKVLNSLTDSMESARYYNLGLLNAYSPQDMKSGTAPKSLYNAASRKFRPSPRSKTALINRNICECDRPSDYNWRKIIEPPFKFNKDVYVSVSSSSLEPKIKCECDAAVGTHKSQSTRKTKNKKKHPPRQAVDTSKMKTIEKERLKELAKKERNSFFTHFISNIADTRVDQTKQRFSVRCMKYVFLGLLVVVWSPCLLALLLGSAVMCPQRILSSLGGPQLVKPKQTNSNFAMNVTKKRSAKETHRKKNPANTPVNYVKCLPTACTTTKVPPQTAGNKGINISSASEHQRTQVPMNTFSRCIQNKCLPPEYQQTRILAHLLPNKAKIKSLVTGDERTQGPSNILMNYFKNKRAITECLRPQNSSHAKTNRQKNFMSSVANWYTRTVASFSNVVSVLKMIGSRQPTGGRATSNSNPKNRCNLYYGKGRGWLMKPQVIQNMRCEYSPNIRLITSSKDCILKPKSKMSFSRRQECVNVCESLAKRERERELACNKAELDAHFYIVPFGPEQTSAKQQVNIVPKKLDTMIEHPFNPDFSLHSCKHQRITTKGKMCSPHKEPTCVVVPLHGIVIGYPGGSGYYYPIEQTTPFTRKLNSKNKLLIKYGPNNLCENQKPTVIGKKSSYSRSTCYTNTDKPRSEPKPNFSNKHSNIAQSLNRSIIKTTTNRMSTKHNDMPQNSRIQPDNILQGKSNKGQKERATAKKYPYNQYLTSPETRDCKVSCHKYNYKNLPKQLSNRLVNIVANSPTAFESHIKKLNTTMRENQPCPSKNVSPYTCHSITKQQNVCPFLGVSKNALGTNVNRIKTRNYFKSEEIPEFADFFIKTAARHDKIIKGSPKSFIINRSSKLSTIESSTLEIPTKCETKIISTSSDRPSKCVCKIKEKKNQYQKVSKYPCTSRKISKKLPLKEVTLDSHNKQDQRKSPSFGAVKQKTISASSEKASICSSKKVLKQKSPLYKEKSGPSRAINTKQVLDHTTERTSDTLNKKSPNFFSSNNQSDTYLNACDMKESVLSTTLIDRSKKRRTHVLAADYQSDKASSCDKSLKSLQYQRFSDGLKKYLVLSKSYKYNQSNHHTNKASLYQYHSPYNLLYPKHRKVLKNRNSFKKNSPRYSMTDVIEYRGTEYLGHEKQILEYTPSHSLLKSYRKENPPKSYQPMFLKKSLSSIKATSSYGQSLHSPRKLSHCSKCTNISCKMKSYSAYRINKPQKCKFFRLSISSNSIEQSSFSHNNSLSPRFYVSCCSSLSKSTSSSLYRKSDVIGKSVYSSISLKSILGKFKSYDEYEYKDILKPMPSLPCETITKQNLKLYPNLKNNTANKSFQSPCNSLSKKLQTSHISTMAKGKASLGRNKSVITKHQLKRELKKRLQSLDQIITNNTQTQQVLECFNKRYHARTSSSCRSIDFTDKKQLLGSLFCKAGLQDKYNKTVGTGRRLTLPDRPQAEQSSTAFYSRAASYVCKPCQESRTKLMRYSPISVQKRLDLPLTDYQHHQKSIPKNVQRPTDPFNRCYKIIRYPSMEFQRYECTLKSFQNLLNYLHTHFMKWQEKNSAPMGSKRIRNQTLSNCPVVTVHSRNDYKKNNCTQTKRQLCPQDNFRQRTCLLKRRDSKIIVPNNTNNEITNLIKSKERDWPGEGKEKIKMLSKYHKEKRISSEKNTDEERKNMKIRKDEKRTDSPLTKHKRVILPRKKGKTAEMLSKSVEEKRTNSPFSMNKRRCSAVNKVDEENIFIQSKKQNKITSPNRQGKVFNSPKIKGVEQIMCSKYNYGKTIILPGSKNENREKSAKHCQEKKSNSLRNGCRSPKVFKEEDTLNLQNSKKKKTNISKRKRRRKTKSKPKKKINLFSVLQYGKAWLKLRWVKCLQMKLCTVLLLCLCCPLQFCFYCCLEIIICCMC